MKHTNSLVRFDDEESKAGMTTQPATARRHLVSVVRNLAVTAVMLVVASAHSFGFDFTTSFDTFFLTPPTIAEDRSLDGSSNRVFKGSLPAGASVDVKAYYGQPYTSFLSVIANLVSNGSTARGWSVPIANNSNGSSLTTIEAISYANLNGIQIRSATQSYYVAPSSIPVLPAMVAVTNVVTRDMIVEVDGRAESIRLDVNGLPVQPSNYSAFDGGLNTSTFRKTFRIRFDLQPGTNNIVVRSRDIHNVESDPSQVRVIKLADLDVYAKFPATFADDPIYPKPIRELVQSVRVTRPIGSQSDDSTPTADVVNTGNALASIRSDGALVSSNQALKLASHIVSVEWPGPVLKPINITLPVSTLYGAPKPYVFNPISNKWEPVGYNYVLNGTGPTRSISFETTKVGTFAVLASTDTTPPSVQTLQLDGKAVLDNDFISATPTVSVSLTDNKAGDLGLVSWNVRIVNVDSGAVIASTSNAASPTIAAVQVDWKVPSALADETRYQVLVSAEDAGGNITPYQSPTVIVSNRLQLTQLLNGPNPFNNNRETTQIQYVLSKQANVAIYVYTVTGKRIWNTESQSGFSGGQAGFNAVMWDGRDSAGRLVGTGTYIAYIIANDGTTKVVAKLKMAVLQ